MITNKQRRNLILRKIRNMPPDNLKKLQDYMDELEKETPRKRKVLSYAGAWGDLDDATLKDLTDNIIYRRKNNNRRFEG